LERTIAHAAHALPSQGPITVFVHHNTLHAFEDLPFHEALVRGMATYGCHPYLPEDRYRQELARGRILPQDLAAVVMDDLGEESDRLIANLGTRYHARLSMLQHPLRCGTDAELRWLIAETNALFRFRTESPGTVRERMIDRTRHWMMRDFRNGYHVDDPWVTKTVESLLTEFGKRGMERWSDATWEAFTLHLLWQICHRGARLLKRPDPLPPPVRHRDLLLQATGKDTDALVHEVLIRFCAAFLDQGIATWTLPQRDGGFLRSFIGLYRDCRTVEPWLSPLPTLLRQFDQSNIGALDLVDHSLQTLGVEPTERDEVVLQTMLALRGWAGMIWQMETNAEWTVRPAPQGTLVEYLAVRLLLERLAISHLAQEAGLESSDLRELRRTLRQRCPHEGRTSGYQRAYLVFQLAQILGWGPEELYRLNHQQWVNLGEEIEAFSSLQRRRVYHLAYERRYRNQTLDALATRTMNKQVTCERPLFQAICCIDEREESFRRHLEEIAPECETFALAGFFGVAMYYRGAADAHFIPLCPIVIKPQHYVEERVVYSLEEAHRRRSGLRRSLGTLAHRLHLGSRSVMGGMFTALLGSIASAPLVARVLFPRLTARLQRALRAFVQPPPITRLALERTAEKPGRDSGEIGYSVDEMAAIVERMLRDAGLTSVFARLVLMVGHGSSSLNNPHEAAHDCGACGGARGGPNARAFAQMANDPRIRSRLAGNNLVIPTDTVFVGAYHNTCDDLVTYFDLDQLPSSHRRDFEQAKEALDEARCRNAHERCRRFFSAELSLTPQAALRHVEGRAEDLSQVRPEYGHATNAICVVGRRARTKGLFMDRRAFLTSYDPTQDDEDSTILTRILQAVIPVCAGISLEYYFSFVDAIGYGCGTKLPHNITSLLGVMDGAASDLRPGLPWQMVEIHEPVRILFIIETTSDAMLRIVDKNPALGELCRNEWIQLATIDPHSSAIHVYSQGRFEPYLPETTTLPAVASSVDWYRGWRDHLGYASIVGDRGTPLPARPEEGAA
jgi:uncharacterized protein YbcC (UPF0753/DUF2309 family)